MASDPNCPPGPQPNNDGLEEVIVYAKPHVQTTYSVPPNSVILDRFGCRFIPHTITMQVGQALVIRNSDVTAHVAHSDPRRHP
jgi:hypothetical protein